MGLFGIMFSFGFVVTAVVAGMSELRGETTIVTANPIILEIPKPTVSEIPSEILALVAPDFSYKVAVVENSMVSPIPSARELPPVTPTPEPKIETTPKPTKTPALPLTKSPTNTPQPKTSEVLGITVSSTPAPTISAPTATPTSVTPTPTQVVVSAQEIDSYFEKYSREYNVDINLLRKIAVCESGYNTNSKSKHGYAGMFQFSESAWRGARNRMGHDANPDLRFNPEESIKTAAFKISRDGTGAWPACSK